MESVRKPWTSCKNLQSSGRHSYYTPVSQFDGAVSAYQDLKAGAVALSCEARMEYQGASREAEFDARCTETTLY